MQPIQKSILFEQKKLILSEYQSDHKRRAARRPEILCFHANGFAAGSYAPLHRKFYTAGYDVAALDFVGHGDSQSEYDFKDWNYFRDQVLALAESRTGEIVLLGHSLGGASVLMAAGILQQLGRPLRAVLLWDPTIFSPLLVRGLPFIKNPMAGRARARRRQFKSLNLVRRSYRMQDVFKNWAADCFDAYIESSFIKIANGYELKLDPEIEARIFERYPRRAWQQFRVYKGPLLVLTPEKHMVCPPRSARMLVRKNQNSIYQRLPGSHFFPFECPAQTVAHSLEFLAGLPQPEQSS